MDVRAGGRAGGQAFAPSPWERFSFCRRSAGYEGTCFGLSGFARGRLLQIAAGRPSLAPSRAKSETPRPRLGPMLVHSPLPVGVFLLWSSIHRLCQVGRVASHLGQEGGRSRRKLSIPKRIAKTCKSYLLGCRLSGDVLSNLLRENMNKLAQLRAKGNYKQAARI